MGCVLGVFVVCLFYIVVSWWVFFWGVGGWVGGRLGVGGGLVNNLQMFSGGYGVTLFQ